MSTSSFADVAEAIREIALYERLLMRFAGVQELKGRGLPATPAEQQAWRERIARIEAGARMFEILIPHEHVVRSLDPLLLENAVTDR